MWVTLSTFKARTSSRCTYAYLCPWYNLFVRDTFSCNMDAWSKKPLIASLASSTSMLGSMSAISNSILGMRWRTVPLASITSCKAASSRPLPSLEHFSSISKSVERVSLIPWTQSRRPARSQYDFRKKQCSFSYFSVMAADKSLQSYNLWKDNTNLLYGKKFSETADEFSKVRGKFV